MNYSSARMNPLVFAIFTAFGAGIWVVVLVMTGYWFGNNQQLINQYLHQIALGIAGFSIIIIAAYVFFKRRRAVGVQS